MNDLKTSPPPLTVTERIDADKGLKTKARLLTFTSLIFIGIMLTGASIEEANTFVFKVVVTNQSGLPVLLIISVLFLIIRYYSYAKPYHSELEKTWTSRLLKHSFYLSIDPYSDEPSGIIYDLQPSGYGLGNPDFGYQNKDQNSCCYHRGWFLCRHLDYWWFRDVDSHDSEIRINLFKSLSIGAYLQVLWLEFKYRAESLVIDREYLDIFGPYLIALLAFASFFFRSDVQFLVNTLMAVSR